MLTSASDLKEIFYEEIVETGNLFHNRALDHQDLLDEEESDVLRKAVGNFI